MGSATSNALTGSNSASPGSGSSRGLACGEMVLANDRPLPEPPGQPFTRDHSDEEAARNELRHVLGRATVRHPGEDRGQDPHADRDVEDRTPSSADADAA